MAKGRRKEKMPPKFYWPYVFASFMTVIALVIGFSSYQYYCKHFSHSHYVSKLKSKLKTVFEKRTTSNTNNQTQDLSTALDTQIQFDFYTTLPNTQLKIDEEPIINKSTSLPLRYIVQLGVFKSEESALQYQHSIKFADIHTKKMLNGFYRVEIGPYVLKENASFAQKELQKMGINGIIKKIA